MKFSRSAAVAFTCALAFPQAARLLFQAASRAERSDFVLVSSGVDSRTVLAVISELARAADRRVSIGANESRKLEVQKVVLTGPLKVPASKIESALESIAFTYGFIFLPPESEDLPWTLVDLEGFDRNQIRTRARLISVEEIDAYASRYVMVSVVLKLQRVDALKVSASLRPFFPESGLERVIAIPTSNSLQISAVGPTVAALTKLVRGIDREPTAVDEKAEARKKEIADLKARIAALEKRLEAQAGKPK